MEDGGYIEEREGRKDEEKRVGETEAGNKDEKKEKVKRMDPART